LGTNAINRLGYKRLVVVSDYNDADIRERANMMGARLAGNGGHEVIVPLPLPDIHPLIAWRDQLDDEVRHRSGNWH